MTYYRYRPDANNYAGISFYSGIPSPEHKRVLGIRRIDHSLLDEWVPPTAHGFEDNPPRDGDFPSLSDYNEIPVMSQRAWEALRPLIGYCCEALPFNHPSGDPFYIIHAMETIDCLDDERSELTRNATTGRVNQIFKYAFKPGMLEGKHIFKLPIESGGELLVDDEFRKVVEEHGLKGLQFKPLPMVGDEDDEEPADTGPSETAAERSRHTVATDRPLDDEEAAEVQEQLEVAYEVLGIDPDSAAPDDIQQRIYEEINAIRETDDSSDPRTLENAALGLGCLWAQSVCDALGWEWASITLDEREQIGIVSPSRSLVVFALGYLNGLLNDPSRDQTSLLLYNMLKADSFSAPPGAYEVLG